MGMILGCFKLFVIFVFRRNWLWVDLLEVSLFLIFLRVILWFNFWFIVIEIFLRLFLVWGWIMRNWLFISVDGLFIIEELELECVIVLNFFVLGVVIEVKVIVLVFLICMMVVNLLWSLLVIFSVVKFVLRLFECLWRCLFIKCLSVFWWFFEIFFVLISNLLIVLLVMFIYFFKMWVRDLWLMNFSCSVSILKMRFWFDWGKCMNVNLKLKVCDWW